MKICQEKADFFHISSALDMSLKMAVKLLLLSAFLLCSELASAALSLDSSAQEISRLTGIPQVEIEALQGDYRANPARPLIVRLAWSTTNRWTRTKEFASRMVSGWGGPKVHYLTVTENEAGAEPLVLPSGSVVFHRLGHHDTTIIGEFNPGLNNSSIGTIMGNKWIEYLFWEDYLPGLMPKTILLSDLVQAKSDPRAVQDRINERMPKGWVIKNVYDQNTSKDGLVTSSDDFATEVGYVLESGEWKEIERIRKDPNMDGDAKYKLIRKMKGAKGWRMALALKYPFRTIVQERLEISKEFRVEVVGGRVLKGAGTTRHGLWRQMTGGDRGEVARAEEFVEGLLRRLPEEIRAIPMALDIALLVDGSFRMIESNPQGNSGFFDMPHASAKLNEFLSQIPSLARSGHYHSGLSAAEQMSLIQDFLKRHQINLEEQFPKLVLSESKAEFTVYTKRSMTCASQFRQ